MSFSGDSGTVAAMADQAVPDPFDAAVSVIVPTRNEAGNVNVLLRRLDALPAGTVAEVLVVDDSDDDTPAAVLAEVGRHPFRVTLLHREPDERAGGLSGAVLAGWRQARSPYVCVMDGDLQHPPELVADLVAIAGEEGADLVCATRFGADGRRRGLSRFRRGISGASSTAARVLFPRRLRGVTDPMSGFFLARRDAVDLDRLNPTGFKVLLELLVRTPGLRRTEVAYEFRARHSGDSKASVQEGIRYARHLGRLRLGMTPARAQRLRSARQFAAVGVVGTVVNQTVLWLLVSRVGLFYALAAVCATQASTLTNFFLLDAYVFGRNLKGGRLRRYIPFALLNNSSLLIRIPLLALLVSGVGINYLVANLLVLLCVYAFRFFASERIWRQKDAVPEGALPHRYDVGGIVSIASAIELRELGWFQVPASVEPADIEIRRGLVGSRRPRRRLRVTLTAGTVLYEEQLGALFTNFAVDLNGPAQVTVGPLLARSPHVVYTNVVEALLRFILVSRGHMLLHGACFELDGTGVLLSARTDTGKTGTILRVLRERGATFLSDDMTILSPNGVARSYPKPLTISAHTLRAVDPTVLNRRERTKLAIQSRLHSKSGRAFGAWLAEHNLPIMALNSLTQAIVPPPKYMADRLVPCTIGRTTRVTDLFIIERGTPGIEDITPDRTLDELIENTDDAYGFPPFEHFAPAIALRGDGYQTLRAKEQAILARALGEVRARRVRSDSFAWADMIPELLEQDRVREASGGAAIIDLRTGAQLVVGDEATGGVAGGLASITTSVVDEEPEADARGGRSSHAH